MRAKNNLLEVQNLSIQFLIEQNWFSAVKNISFCIKPSEVVGIIGESGCGKSITAFSLLKLLPHRKSLVQGKINFQKTRIDHLQARQFSDIRGKKISMIFQDPLSCFNPVLKIRTQLLEMFPKNGQARAMEKIHYLFSQVGFSEPLRILQSYPHQLSGGMRQRIMIVMALLFEPDLLIADEPTTALDTTVQSQILYLLKKLQQQKKMSLLLITHDLGVIAQTCDFVYVMYFGEIVEQGTVSKIFSQPAHPYTKGLIDMLSPQKEIAFIRGKVPSIQETFQGCPFASRCNQSKERCFKEPVELRSIDTEHSVSCHFPHTKSRKH
jgi:peptide/nickel transport system ATP-binding protein